jgi:hypothetical protein
MQLIIRCMKSRYCSAAASLCKSVAPEETSRSLCFYQYNFIAMPQHRSETKDQVNVAVFTTLARISSNNCCVCG